MKILPALIYLSCVTLVFTAQSAKALSEENRIQLHKEAQALEEKATSAEDLRRAAEKFKEAMRLHIEAGDLRNAGDASNQLGMIETRWGQYKNAVKFFESSVTMLRVAKDLKGEALPLSNMGGVYWRLGQYGKAVECLEKALEICRRLGDQQYEGNILNNLGLLYRAWGQYPKALEYYEKALRRSRRARDDKNEAKIMGNVGVLYWSWGKYDQSEAAFEKELEIALGSSYPECEAQAYAGLGLVNRARCRYQKAVENYEKTLLIAGRLGDVQRQSETLLNIGAAYSGSGQYGKAWEYYEKSGLIARKLRDVKGRGLVLANEGNLYQIQGQYQRAVEFYEKSLVIFRNLADQEHEADVLSSLGTVNAKRGNYHRAVEYFKKSLDMARKTGNLKSQGPTLHDLGVVQSKWGQYDNAVIEIRRAFEIYRKLGDIKGEAETLLSIGLIHEHRGDLEQALTNFEKGLSLYEKISFPVARPKDLIGRVYLEMGDLGRAESYIMEGGQASSLGRLRLAKSQYIDAKSSYESVLKWGEKTRDLDSLFTSYTGLGKACEALGENAQAAEHYRRAVDLTEALRSSLDATERETFFDVKINGFYRTAPYEGLARVLVKKNKRLEAFKQSEYSKARLFAEAISKRGEHAGLSIPKEIREKDAVLNDRLSALSNNLQKAYEKGNKEATTNLEPQVKDAKEKVAAHVERLRKEYPLFAATRYPQPMGLDKTSLTDGEWVVEYDVTDSDLLIYVIRGKNVVKAVRKEIGRKDLNKLVKKFRESFDGVTEDNLGEKLQAFDFQAGKKLADILLTDVLPELPRDAPVIVIPDDCLGVIPFEMLVLNTEGKISTNGRVPQTINTEFFGDRNPVSYYQSITALTLARTLGTPGEDATKLLVMADPVFGKDDPRITRLTERGSEDILDKTTEQVIMSAKVDNHITWPRLPRTRELGESLKKEYPNVTDLLEGFRASKAAFLQTDLNPYRSIVFATHGYGGNNLGGLQEPVLVLTLVNQPPGQDGFLRMTEVMGKKLNADIVALTGCQTGLGRRISGEGTMNMGRAFQYAGANSVLMSLWSVEQSASVKLVESFFKQLKEGKSKLEALKLARSDIRKRGFDHPFFWAPFILVGEAN